MLTYSTGFRAPVLAFFFRGPEYLQRELQTRVSATRKKNWVPVPQKTWVTRAKDQSALLRNCFQHWQHFFKITNVTRQVPARSSNYIWSISLRLRLKSNYILTKASSRTFSECQWFLLLLSTAFLNYEIDRQFLNLKILSSPFDLLSPPSSILSI